MGCQQLSIACSSRFGRIAKIDQENAKVGLPERLTLICVNDTVPHWHHRICRMQNLSMIRSAKHMMGQH